MADEAEVLVHIAAPSTSTDDSIYRALARGYLDFEPLRKTELPPIPEPTDVPSSQDALISPQLSFNSVWENIRSPVLARVRIDEDNTYPKATGKESQVEQCSQGSWIPPPSEVADSMPDNDISMDGFNTPTRILNYFLQTTNTFSQSSQEIDDEKRDTTIYEGNEDFTSPLVQTTPLRESNTVQKRRITEGMSQIIHHTPQPHHSPLREAWGATTAAETTPAHFPLPKNPIPPARSPGGLRTVSTNNSPLSSLSKIESHERTIPSTQLPERADSEPPSSKRPRLGRTRRAIQGRGRSASEILPRGPHGAVAASADTSRDEVDSAEPLVIDWSGDTQIVSVEPAPSNHKLGPKPPAYLEWYVNHVGMASRYQPKFQARKMRPFERGYWLLDLDGWDYNAKVEAWDFLGNFIRRDSCAGWGTRACRDEQWGWIRLYGWEHLAGELYILLYVASYQRTKYMELTWYDGAGEKLIIVGARAEKTLAN